MAIAAQLGAARALSLRTILLYRAIDWFSGILIGLMAVLSPWMFGTTQSWAICAINGCGYALGILLVLKLILRCLQTFQPARWEASAPGLTRLRLFTAGLAALNALILVYTLVAALALVLARWFVPAGIPSGLRFTTLLWLPLAGCLLRARFDFPFQIHSLQLLFLPHCAILSCLSRHIHTT